MGEFKGILEADLQRSAKKKEIGPQKHGGRIRIKVTHKKGDVEHAGNYRPMCTLPASYTLFSTLLYNRLYSRLDFGQPADQGGFQRSYQTLDHLATCKLLEQRCREWRVKMWTATVLPESLRHGKAQNTVDRARTIRYRTTLHQPLEEAIKPRGSRVC